MMKVRVSTVRSTVAFIIYALLITGGFVFAAYKTAAPYLAFASQLTIGFGAYIARRYMNNKLYVGKQNVGND